MTIFNKFTNSCDLHVLHNNQKIQNCGVTTNNTSVEVILNMPQHRLSPPGETMSTEENVNKTLKIGRAGVTMSQPLLVPLNLSWPLCNSSKCHELNLHIPHTCMV